MDTEDCLEHCQGTIMDYDKVNNIVNKEDWKGILQDYDYLKLDESKILQKLISHDILKGKRYKTFVNKSSNAFYF